MIIILLLQIDLNATWMFVFVDRQVVSFVLCDTDSWLLIFFYHSSEHMQYIVYDRYQFTLACRWLNSKALEHNFTHAYWICCRWAGLASWLHVLARGLKVTTSGRLDSNRLCTVGVGWPRSVRHGSTKGKLTVAYVWHMILDPACNKYSDLMGWNGV